MNWIVHQQGSSNTMFYKCRPPIEFRFHKQTILGLKYDGLDRSSRSATSTIWVYDKCGEFWKNSIFLVSLIVYTLSNVLISNLLSQILVSKVKVPSVHVANSK